MINLDLGDLENIIAWKHNLMHLINHRQSTYITPPNLKYSLWIVFIVLPDSANSVEQHHYLNMLWNCLLVCCDQNVR